ncbi:MAG TPA: aminopeptidase P family protein [Candidatus Cryptobacteroides excrementigallinarum]|nr:aminopeptidase P family protein [Candidatus Cryptobacteroides excrementigallinarum]
MENIYRERIERLRGLMRARNWDAVLVTGGDPHGSEYPAERWKQVQWLSGFTGEAGDIVVTLDHAGLWTDTRYFIQARRQLEGTGVELHKTRVPGQVLIPEWLEMQFGDEGIIALDGLCAGVDFARSLPGTVVSVPDMLSLLWQDRPEIPDTPVFTVQAGETRESKLAWLRDFIAGTGCDGMLLTALDEIAWLLNVRAADIEYNPLVISCLLVTDDSVDWFVTKDGEGDPQTSATMDILRSEGISVRPYLETEQALPEFRGRLFVDCSTLNWSFFDDMRAAGVDLYEGRSPVGFRKAVKNSFELDGMRSIHVRDGVAMERFLYWLEKSVQSGREISEWDAAVKLGRLRAEIPEYMGDSFETISAYGPAAALPHYVTPHANAPVLREQGLYLCDSGGQYSCGTTDITRTVPLGECTPLEREDYTLVLKGHIDLAMAVFPAGTAGCQIDALARGPLWRSFRNFGHGTGHGIGFFLGVHEGPQDIRQNFNSTPLLPGMITSDEPGIYREGMHGVRHENLLLCVDAGTNEFGSWRAFEVLTLCHFDTAAIEPGLLGEDERRWLNSYNERVYATLGHLLPEEEREWLRIKTRPI